MREIQFRGISIKTKKFIYGDLQHNEIGDTWISMLDSCFSGYGLFENVDYKTIGQRTGLKDKNGVYIYEGDIVELRIDFGYGTQSVIAKVIYKNAGFQFDSDAGCAYGSNDVCEVIGNIYENPELLKDNQ